MGRTRWMLLSALLLGVAAQAHAQSIIAANRRIDWSKAGVIGGIPVRTTICATLNPGATAAQISSAIASCAAPNRTFLVFTGVDACAGLGGASICVFNGNSNSGDAGNWGNYANWTAGYAGGATTITLSAVTNLQVGSTIILDQCNDGLSGNPTGATNSGCATGASADNGNLWVCQAINVCSQQGATYLSRAPGNRNQTQLVQVTSISGSGPY